MSAIGKNVFNIVLVVIVLFVAKHFLSDFGLKLYKMYYGIENLDMGAIAAAVQEQGTAPAAAGTTDSQSGCQAGIPFAWYNSGVLKKCSQLKNELGPYAGQNTGGWLIGDCEAGRTTSKDCNTVSTLSFGKEACKWGRKLKQCDEQESAAVVAPVATPAAVSSDPSAYGLIAYNRKSIKSDNTTPINLLTSGVDAAAKDNNTTHCMNTSSLEQAAQIARKSGANSFFRYIPGSAGDQKDGTMRTCFSRATITSENDLKGINPASSYQGNTYKVIVGDESYEPEDASVYGLKVYNRQSVKDDKTSPIDLIFGGVASGKHCAPTTSLKQADEIARAHKAKSFFRYLKGSAGDQGGLPAALRTCYSTYEITDQNDLKNITPNSTYQGNTYAVLDNTASAAPAAAPAAANALPASTWKQGDFAQSCPAGCIPPVCMSGNCTDYPPKPAKMEFKACSGSCNAFSPGATCRYDTDCSQEKCGTTYFAPKGDARYKECDNEALCTSKGGVWNSSRNMCTSGDQATGGQSQTAGAVATAAAPAAQGTSPQGTSGCVTGCNPPCKEFTGCSDKQSCQTKYSGVSMGTWTIDASTGKPTTSRGYEDCDQGCNTAYKRGCDMAPYSPSGAEARVADAAAQASQMHSDAQNATNEVSVSPGASIGSWGDSKDSGIPADSVASQAASSNLATQQIIPGTAYPSNTTVANVSGVYPTQASLNNIQGGNVPQAMAGVNTGMAPSPLAPSSSEAASKANDAISRNIRGRDEEDAAIDISINMKMSEHVAKNLVGSVPQYTTPQQYASGRTTGLDNNAYNPSYQSMPQQSLGATYDNRLGGNYPSYAYNTQNNTGTAYTNQYKPVNPGKKPKPYNSLMDLFR